MTIISAYQDSGTYRGAAAICGTTPKTGNVAPRVRYRPFVRRRLVRPGCSQTTAPVLVTA
jgi:hypothetical protein